MPYLPSKQMTIELDVCYMDTSREGSEMGHSLFFFFLPLSSLQVSESPEYAYWWYCGGAGVHGVCVGITQQGYTPQAEEAVSNHICSGHHAV